MADRPYTVNAGKGNDNIDVEMNNTTIYGGLGNDEIFVRSNDNIVDAGKGNDYIVIEPNELDYESYEIRAENNVVVFHNGDGNDRLSAYYSDVTLKFADSLLSDITLVQFGNYLQIKYNSGADSVSVYNPLPAEDEEDDFDSSINITLEDKNGYKKDFIEFIKNYGGIPDAYLTEINGTDTDDDIVLPETDSSLTVNLGKGDDSLFCYKINDSAIYGGEGNDSIELCGTGNTIYGGKGNDYISDYEGEYGNNTLVFNNGDGNDTISFYMETQQTLRFADAAQSDLEFIKSANDLIIRYSDKDSVKISGYLAEESSNASYMVKCGESAEKPLAYLLLDGIKTEAEASTITGTNGNDIIDVPYRNGDNVYDVSLDKKYIIEDYSGENDVANISSGEINESDVMIIFNVQSEFDDDSLEEVSVISKDDIDIWANTGNCQSVNIKRNTIETINLNNNLTISSSDIEELAMSISAWLTDEDRDYSDVISVLTSGNNDDISALKTYFAENTNWQTIE